MLVPGFYEDLSVLHDRTVPVHSYFIPSSRPGGGAAGQPPREDSDRMQLLSGCDWDFRYFPSIYEVREEFFRPDYAPDQTWRRERVPFAWQMRGYDRNQYTNIRYPFPFDPPFVPRQNPCGAYLHRFCRHWNPEAPRTYLHFEGVDSCFYVWLNGHYAGYSQVTHHTSEFEVTDLLEEGENLLAVLVLKWCDGSYLEDQDKFRMSGIIRDVYLIDRPENHIQDYVIRTELAEDLETADLVVRFSFDREPVPVDLELLSWSDGSVIERVHASGRTEVRMKIAGPALWSAETPALYPLLIETGGEVITERVGFRKVCVRDGVVLLNGSPVIFRGVNRHESDPVTGPVVSREQVLRDLRMIKDHNFNAVRASHYPNVPWFYQLCDEMGLYVVDEADNESHGTAPLYFREDDYSERMRLAHERIADNPDFIEPTLDRVRSMVLRNRNRPSILVWSMGNECGYGCTFEASLRWTKQTDPSRLTHYESAFYLSRDRDYDLSDIDLFGRMYPAFDEVTDYLREDPDKPLLLVEYCHSMGNSPGDLQEYRDLTEQYPRLCGGFVWEWCDHAVCKGKTADGRTMYWYGGDHGELQHDGNFCLDGLVYPDRTPHTGLLEYKNVHRPLRASFDPEKRILLIRSHWDFLDPASCVRARWSLQRDGDEIAGAEFAVPSVRPRGEAAVFLDVPVPDRGRCFLTVTWILKSAAAGLEPGHVLGFDEIRIPTADDRNRKAAALFEDGGTGPLRIREEGTDLRILGGEGGSVSAAGKSRGEARADGRGGAGTQGGFSYVLDTLTGRFTSLCAGGREFLRKPVDFNLWRAPTDNDQAQAALWRWERLDHTVTRAYEVSRETEEDAVLIRVRQSVAAESVQPILRMRTEYRVRRDGSIRMEVFARKDPEIGTLPRLGLRFFLDPVLEEAEYFGIGPAESYIDKCRSGRHGLYRARVADLHEDYIRPQENGSHCDCDFVRLAGGGASFSVAADGPETFSFNASVYTQEELEGKRHNYELETCGDTVLCIDHRMAGIGSASCGPDLPERYRVDADEFHFVFLFRLDTE